MNREKSKLNKKLWYNALQISRLSKSIKKANHGELEQIAIVEERRCKKWYGELLVDERLAIVYMEMKKRVLNDDELRKLLEPK